MISDRNMAVLRAIIEDFIATSEPVGSKTLVERHNFGVSSATIRNDMAVLEEEGYIAAPHTSSGRVPTDKGYRAFVDQLIQSQAVTADIQKNFTELNQLFSKTLDQLTDLDERLHTSAQLLAKATGEAAVVQYPNLKSIAIRSVEFIKVADHRVLILLITNVERIAQHVVVLPSDINTDELDILKAKFNAVCAGIAVEAVTEKLEDILDEVQPSQVANVQVLIDGLKLVIDVNRNDKVAFAGTSNLVRSEEQFAGGLSSLLEAFDDESDIWQVLNLWKLEAEKPRVIIGSENSVFELSKSSLLLSSYSNHGTEVAKVAVVGPTRMNYSRNLAAVLALSKLLSKDQED